MVDFRHTDESFMDESLVDFRNYVKLKLCIMENLVEGKRVLLELDGLDGNAFSLMGAFSKQARKEGWTSEEIKKVTDECMNGDYNHLLQTLLAHTGEEDDD